MSPSTEGGDFKPIAELDQVIHAPARLAIMSLLFVVQSADFIFLQKHTGLTRGNLSSHLSKLEAAEYITVNKEFVERMPRTLLKLTDKGSQAFQAYRRDLQQALGDSPMSGN